MDDTNDENDELDYVEIASQIRARRAYLGLTLKDVEGISGFASSGLSQIETGARNPTRRTLKKIAEALGMDPAGLLAAKKTTKET